LPNAAELDEIADQLLLAPADLMALSLDAEPAVVVQRADHNIRSYPPGNQPVARLAELARTRRQSSLKGFAIDVVADGRGAPYSHGLHQYLYNYGEEPVRMFWGQDRETTLAPGDSAYLRPLVPHSFAPTVHGRDGNLVVVRTPGAMNDTVLDEYASFAATGRQRVIQETTKWF
jgi:methylphosphonate synthase